MLYDVANNENRYQSEVVECSRDLSPKERIKMCDMGKHKSLQPCVKDGEVIDIDVAGYAIVNIHNPKSTKKQDYSYIIIEDKNGDTYFTGSESFVEQFMGLWKVMKDYMDEFQIEVFSRPSKNHDVGFLTCSLK